ncbi:MAG: hypothetical protein ACI3ZN_10555 [Candidatus Cryptobacteroides sp.]
MGHKNYLFFAAVVAVLMVAASCEREGTSRFKGNYTYNMSGNVTVQRDTVSSTGEARGLDTLVMNLTSEVGQMDILEVDRSGGKMILTMRSIDGQVTVADAVASGKMLDFEPFVKTKTLSLDNLSVIKTDMNITFTGYGEKYSDVVVFRIEASGQKESMGITYKIIDSDIEWVARSN